MKKILLIPSISLVIVTLASMVGTDNAFADDPFTNKVKVGADNADVDEPFANKEKVER